MEAPTVRQLESRILHSRKTQSSLGAPTNVIRINTAGQQRPLFSLCGRYGHAVRLLPVLHSLGPDQPCYALQPPAMDWTTVGCATIQQMAAHYIGEVKALQPCGPYRLLGTSFGGLVTFEMALQLQRSGEQVEFLGMVDTNPPTCVFEDAIDVGNSSRLEKTRPARPNSIEARNQRVAESHLRARRKYVLDGRSNQSLFGGELTYFYCTGNPVIAGNDRRRLWERFARGFLLVPVPGLHGAFNREPQSTALQNLLRERLNGHARISSDPTAVFGREYRLENGAQQETIVSSTGKSYQIENSCRQGNVETARIGAQKITIAGWAVEHCLKQPAQNIVVFCGDKLLGYGASGIQRPEVAERLGAASAEHAGFFFRFERHLMEAECGQLRVFVLSSDGHATELGLMATASLRAKAKRTKRQARMRTPSAE